MLPGSVDSAETSVPRRGSFRQGPQLSVTEGVNADRCAKRDDLSIRVLDVAQSTSPIKLCLIMCRLDAIGTRTTRTISTWLCETSLTGPQCTKCATLPVAFVYGLIY